MWVCRKCGSSNSDNDSNCIKCGHKRDHSQKDVLPWLSKKSVLILACALAAVVSVIWSLKSFKEDPAGAAASVSSAVIPTEPPQMCGENVSWVLENGVLTISGTGAMDDYTYAAWRDSDAPWSARSEEIESVVIKEGVTTVGSCAFSKCINLKHISIPDSVRKAGDRFAEDCLALTDIAMPETIVLSAGENVYWTLNDGILTIRGTGPMYDFRGNFEDDDERWSSPWGRGFYKVIIENGVTSIGRYAFYGAENLLEVEIPDSVTAIKAGAFWACSSLKSITIPASVTTIGGGTITWCEELTDINVADGNAYYTSEDGILYSADKTELIAYPPGKECKDLVVPDGIVAIGNGAFYGCTKLETVVLPASIERIDDVAFYWCINLKTLTRYDSVSTISESAFRSCDNLSITVLPTRAPSKEDIQALIEEDESNLIRFPKESSYLPAYETMYVKSERGNSIFLYWAPIADNEYRRKYYVKEDCEVTVLARENGCSCIIFTNDRGSQICGWVTSTHLFYEK